MQRYSAEDFSRMIYVNVFALAQLTMSYVPEMVERGSGRILNVSSIAGYVVPHGLECGYERPKRSWLACPRACLMISLVPA